MAAPVGKLKRINARLRGTAAAEIPAPYTVKCECGCEMQGDRSSSWKQTVCGECMSDLYLLPRNVYPGTISVPNDVIGGSFGARLSVVAGEMARLPGRRPKSRPAVQEPAPDVAAAKKDEPDAPTVVVPRVSLRDRLRRTFTPLRLLAFGMLLLVTATLAAIWQQNRVENARTQWRTSMDQIPELLDAADFPALESALTTAVAAGAILGRDDAEWRLTFNLLEETQALSSLASASLPIILQEADLESLNSPEELQRLSSTLEHQTFVVDGYIDPAGETSAEFNIDVPVPPGRPVVQVRLELQELQPLISSGGDGRCIFAFRVDEIVRADEDGSETWSISVDPYSFALLTSAVHCTELGWNIEEDEELENVLLSQRSFIEESIDWADRHDAIAERQLVESGDAP